MTPVRSCACPLYALIALALLLAPAARAAPTDLDIELDLAGYDLERAQPPAALETPACGLELSALPEGDAADGLMGDLWLRGSSSGTRLRRVVSASGEIDAPLEPGDVYVAACGAHRVRLLVQDVDGLALRVRRQLEPLPTHP